MKPLPVTFRETNRRALVVIITVLAGVVLAAAAAVLGLQRQQLRADVQAELGVEMALLGELATDALLRSDYSTVEGLIQRWVERHDGLHQVTATMPNGFVLAEVRKPEAAIEPLQVTQHIAHLGQPLLTMQATGDFARTRNGFAAIVWQVTAVSVVVVLLIGWLLWQTLQRTALNPLAAQIHRREEKERELVQRTGELEAALRELETFSYTVSHDLRSPLRAIDGYCHALIEDGGATLNDTAREYLTRTRMAAQRMGRLIDGLLLLSRVTKRELHRSTVDLSGLARDTLARLARDEPQRQVTVTVTDSLPVQADAALMAVVLDNLLGNAWKYTGKTNNARIDFRQDDMDGQVVYTVRDNGAGFDMQFADKLFLPFQRLHATKEYEGSGIGLATVARIIQRHGGRVWAESVPGAGAIFRFTLPGTPSKQAPPPAPSP